MKQNVVLTDFYVDKNWSFLSVLTSIAGGTWSVEYRRASNQYNLFHKIKSKLLFLYFHFSLFLGVKIMIQFWLGSSSMG